MNRILLKVVGINILIGILLTIISYFFSFLSGYASSANHLTDEKILFAKFIAVHLLINLVVLRRFKEKLSLTIQVISFAVIIIYYLIMALFLWYL